MKQFTTNKIVIEMTKQEITDLMDIINSAEMRYYEKRTEGYYKTMGNIARKMWLELDKIKNELPF